MYHRDTQKRKLFGGMNFIVVLWVLLSLFRLKVFLDTGYTMSEIGIKFISIIIPLLFLTLLNLMIGISSFFPRQHQHIWALSLILVTLTLVALNAYQTKIEAYAAEKTKVEKVEF